MSASERRRDARLRTAFEVVNAFPPLEGIALLCDVSAQGARLEGTPARPALGQTVQLSVRVSDREPPWVILGKVVRLAETGFAVAFDKPPPQLERLIGDELPPELPLENARPDTRRGPVAKRAGVSPYREVAVDCCASTQWITGRICTLPTRPLLDHVNLGEPFVRVVDAVAPHQPDPMAFLALRSDALDLILPLDGKDAITEQRVGRIVDRPIKCLLPYAVLEGTIGVIDKIRVSDHLMRCNAFIAVRDCQIRLAKGQRPPRDISRVAIALVNVRRVIGIFDLAASTPPPDEPPAS